MRTTLHALCVLLITGLVTLLCSSCLPAAEQGASEPTALGLPLSIPADWQAETSISPRLRVWRSPLSDSMLPAEEAGRPSLVISRENRQPQQSFDQVVAHLRQLSNHLFAEVEILTDEAIPSGHQFILTYHIGPLRWQQQWLLIDDNHGESPALISVILSSSQEQWPMWQDTRHHLIGSLQTLR